MLTSYRRNSASRSEGTEQGGAATGQPAPHDKLALRRTNPLQHKLQDLDMQVKKSQKATQRVVK